MKNYLKSISFLLSLFLTCISETKKSHASQTVENAASSTSSVASTIASALKGEAPATTIVPPPPHNISENVPESNDINQNYLTLVIRALGASLIPDNDFFAQAVTILGVENPYPGDAQTICIARSSGNRIFKISSDKKRKPRMVKNPSEIETYNYFFVKRKGEKVRYTITKSKRGTNDNDESNPTATPTSTPLEKTYDAIFVAKYFDNICFVRIPINDTIRTSPATIPVATP